MHHFLTIFFLAFFCLISSDAIAQLADPVQLTSGLVSGKSVGEASVKAYLGIPFAAPPVGELRWSAPQSVEPWDGVKAADIMQAGCTSSCTVASVDLSD